MKVKEILLKALERSNNVSEGLPASAKDLDRALKFCQSRMNTYCCNNLITAFQKVCTIPKEQVSQEFTIGKFVLKENKRMLEIPTYSRMPLLASMVPGVDYIHVLNTDKYYGIKEVEVD